MIICSIQHTGTKFLRNMFGEVHHASFSEDVNPNIGKFIRVGHISPGLIDSLLARLMADHAIIPLRHPRLVYESWRRRGKSLTDLENNYDLLINKIDKFNPFYLAIDSIGREAQLEQINKDLKLDLKTDWNPTNVVSNTFDLDWRDLPSVEIENDDFWSRFYI